MKNSCLALLIFLFAAEQIQATNLYRYKNAQGKTEISHTIPNDRVAYGYDVIDQESGNIVEIVAPQLTAGQVSIKNERERKDVQCRAALDRVYNLYESEAEIAAAEQLAIESTATRMGNAQANVVQLEQRRRQLEEQAARLERAGKMITPTLLDNLDSTDTQITKLQNEIGQRLQEQQVSKNQFSLDLALFRNPVCETLWSRVGS